MTNAPLRCRLFAALVTIGFLGVLTPTASAAQNTNPLVPLVDDFSSYWEAPGEPYDGTGTSGKVLNKAILNENDQIVVSINHEGAEQSHQGQPSPQQARALSDRDADKNVAFELKDGFGPILGRYFQEGYDGGSLNLVKAIMEENGWSGNPAKDAHQYPRPYVQRDTWLPDADHVTAGKNDMAGLPGKLDIKEVPDSLGADGKTHSADYPKNSLEGSFPSGHTNKAYSRGVVLAAMVPRLAPEILARVSEAGNNRLVLGVHYPLDVMAGRVGGMASVASYWDSHQEDMQKASKQLVDYLKDRCRQDGYGSTLDTCIATTGADGAKGYTNTFTDTVSKRPVKDRASALDAYRARMTYGMPRQGGTDKPLVPPKNAEALLAFAYPKLTASQRKEVLIKTAIEDGYPYDHSSNGWDRINLAAALSSRITLDTNGKVVRVTQARHPQVETVQDKKERITPWIVVGAVAILAVLVIAVAAVLFKRRSNKKTTD